MKKQNGITLIALIITIIIMLILVGVTVNVALNGGLFETAKQAASGMNKAQIEERANMTKVVLMADIQTGKHVEAVKTELMNRLKTEFNGEIQGNKVIVENGKYYIVVKNANLDIDVVENVDSNVEATYLTTTNYEINNTEENTINIEFTISSDMIFEEYASAKSTNLTQEEKEKKAVECFCSWYVFTQEDLEGIVTFEQLLISEINAWYYTTYETIGECLEDENVQVEWGTKEEQLYHSLYFYCGAGEKESQEMTVAELVEIFYNGSLENDFNWNTRNLRLFVSKNGGPEEEIANRIDIRTEPKTISYEVEENGTYEFIVKTSDRKVLTNEIFKINNL